MKLTKKLFLATVLMAITSIIFAQNKQAETSVENEYFTDIDGDIIMSLASSDDLDSKLVALQYLESALNNGNTSELVIKALDQLAGEGLTNQTRTNNRLSNNFPEVRRQACLLMSKVPTEHSKNTLISIAIADNEPMVVAAAVQSLGNIGINTNDDAVDAIAFANKRNQVLNPSSSLAMEVLDAFEKLAPNAKNRKNMLNAVTMISTDYHYVTPVRQRAYNLLKKLSSGSSKNNSSNAK